MLDKSNKNVILKIIGAAVAVFILVYLGITIIGPGWMEPDANWR